MINTAEIKKNFQKTREKLFKDPQLHKDSFRFCVSYSLLVEENIRSIALNAKYDFALASAGSFSRRELSPFSDIDLMFIVKEVEECQTQIEEFVRLLWDCGIEVSHTVRDFFDIEKFLNKDLHAFTQFFETRFLLGNEKLYKQWNEHIFSSIENENINALLMDFFEDIRGRYAKYGSSSKTLEPNLKYSAGGLRDLHAVEWMYCLKNKAILTEQAEITQAESFINRLRRENVSSSAECRAVLESYKFILNIRNILHLISKQRNDRLEFTAQQKIARFYNYKKDTSLLDFMKQYFTASNSINRFSKTMIRRIEEEIAHPLSEYLAVQLDDDFSLKGNSISTSKKDLLSLSDILRAFYYRGLYSGRFEEGLRSLVIESVNHLNNMESGPGQQSSAFFREILKLNRNVGETLVNMNELGVLQLILPEFGDLVGFFSGRCVSQLHG